MNEMPFNLCMLMGRVNEPKRKINVSESESKTGTHT